jgi:hypothetical protein
MELSENEGQHTYPLLGETFVKDEHEYEVKQ